ncbi:hypothetical protein BN946_scf184697.g9 [Trametes cinnabarina]|uniref:Uncharacterized protein n=1 Tax=Pycnoporus cinnabarinus TaxID=5643 RepID=A0A060S5M1_PYCCI|nr:hypothetical protein BN946_scf184697.g9 [Trametes cinnabarina]
MIGQIPSLFDPNMANPPQSGLDYQQWVESFANGQYTYSQGGIPGNVSQIPFQQPQPQSQLHHVQTTVPPAAAPQNRYNFVPEQQYATGDQATNFDTHFARPAPADRPQRGMPRISRQGGTTVGYPTAPNLRIPEVPRAQFQQPQLSPQHQQQAFAAAQASESYFYPSVGTDAISSSGDQSHHHSSYNFVQQYQPEPYSATTYTPNSDFTNLPSSVSTPSVGGTEESQHVFSSASSHLSAQAAPQQPQASSSRATSGSAPRGRGRGGVKQGQKRQRIEDAQDGGESETQSEDDQPLSGLNMSMSVPPSQGRSSLPTRL